MAEFRLKATDMVVVLTGAGVSAESGIPTFRDAGGLWHQYNLEDVATPEGWERNPVLVWRFYNERVKALKDAAPNSAHYALAELERKMPEGRFVLVTQNVDDLHEKAGSRNLIHMHGELRKARCEKCERVTNEWNTDSAIPFCLVCGGRLRPHVVWFGEIPFELPTIYKKLSYCTVMIAVGTSGEVYPAAGFLSEARKHGAKTILVNLEETRQAQFIDFFYKGKAGEILPGLVAQWTAHLS